MRAPILGTLILALGSLVAASCSETKPVFDHASFQAQSIEGGVVDTTDTFAVGVCAGYKGSCTDLCSGTLIAPNVVLTARHCIYTVPNPTNVNCSTDNFGGALNSQYWITTYQSLLQSTTGWHKVLKITTPVPTAVCGNDLAILELADNVSSGEASPIEPVGQYPMTDHKRYKTTQTAIGYGKTSVSANDAGTRRILQNIPVDCIPGDPALDCATLGWTVEPTSGWTVSNNEYVAGSGVCPGDSGSGGLEQTHFTSKPPVTMGMLSRGGQSGNDCVGSIYTRTDKWRSLIVSTVTAAAADGGYSVPAWTQPAPPEPDAAVPPDTSVPDTSTPPPPPKGALGDPCTTDGPNGDCQSANCASFDANGFVCTQPCDANDPCPNGFYCLSGLCKKGTAPTTNPGTTTVTTTSGCSSSGSSGADWAVWMVVGLALITGASKRRRS